MTMIYIILAVSGWIWAGVVAIFLIAHWWRLRRAERPVRGFEVMQKHEEQS